MPGGHGRGDIPFVVRLSMTFDFYTTSMVLLTQVKYFLKVQGTPHIFNMILNKKRQTLSY